MEIIKNGLYRDQGVTPVNPLRPPHNLRGQGRDMYYAKYYGKGGGE